MLIKLNDNLFLDRTSGILYRFDQYGTLMVTIRLPSGNVVTLPESEAMQLRDKLEQIAKGEFILCLPMMEKP